MPKWIMLRRSNPTLCLASRCNRKTLSSSLSLGCRRGSAGALLDNIEIKYNTRLFSKLLEYETDWYDMMEIILSRIEDEPVDQDKFQVTIPFFFATLWLPIVRLFLFICLLCVWQLFVAGDRIKGLGKLGAHPARGRHADAEDQG